PITAPGPKQRLWEILDICLRDHRQAWSLNSDGSYSRLRPEGPGEGSEVVGTHSALMELTRRRSHALARYARREQDLRIRMHKPGGSVAQTGSEVEATWTNRNAWSPPYPSKRLCQECKARNWAVFFCWWASMRVNTSSRSCTASVIKGPLLSMTHS